MATYDKTDLTSTLNYIKSEYGTTCFKDGKIIAFLSDLAPSLKREKSLLKKLVDKGLMKEIAENASSDEDIQRRIIFKTKKFLIDEECIREDFCNENIEILKIVFWGKKNEIKHKCFWCGADSIGNNTNFCEKCGGPTIVIDKENKDFNKKDFDKLFKDVEKSMGLKFIYCPSGFFTMGSAINEVGSGGNGKSHRVIISKPFYIGEYPVTQIQYRKLIKRINKDMEAWIGDSQEDYPVGHVNWNDAKNYCEKLNIKFSSKLPKGYKFDLPTEEQWEYAAKTCCIGSPCTPAIDYDDSFDIHCGENSDYHEFSERSTNCNAWGILNMLGTVYEWCRDENSNDTWKTLKGGSLIHSILNCTPSSCLSEKSDSREYWIGFRLALVPIE